MSTAAHGGEPGAHVTDQGPRAGGVLLIVEDEESIGRLVKQYVEQDGWRAVWVRSGEEALAELNRHAVRVVVLDIGLPGMDGFEVCRRIRARSSVPIVMLTARDEEPDRVAGLEIGADDYVPKPFSPRELVARIKAILRRSEQRPQDEILAEPDGTTVSIPVAPSARIRLNGVRVPLRMLKRGYAAETIRDGGAPAQIVDASRR